VSSQDGVTSYAFGRIIGALIMIYLVYRLVRRIARGCSRPQLTPARRTSLLPPMT
jgi:hypothetical protein